MKNRILLILTMLTLCFLCFCGCQNSTLSEAEIIDSLPIEIKTIEIDGMSSVLDVEHFELLLRKTNDDTDEVHCNLILNNGSYSNTVSCVLTYTYYDTGGWILDYWEITNTNLKAIAGLPQMDADQELSMYYFGTFEFDSHTFFEEDQVSYSSYTVEYYGTNYCYNGTVTLMSVFITDWFSGNWVHELHYDDTFDWTIKGAWAADGDDIRDSTSYIHTDAFELFIDANPITEDNEVILSATYFETNSRKKWNASSIDYYCTQIYRVPPRNQELSYKEPIWRLDFYIDNIDFSVEISANTLQLQENEKYIGILHPNCTIAVSENSYGWPIYTKVS